MLRRLRTGVFAVLAGATMMFGGLQYAFAVGTGVCDRKILCTHVVKDPANPGQLLCQMPFDAGCGGSCDTCAPVSCTTSAGQGGTSCNCVGGTNETCLTCVAALPNGGVTSASCMPGSQCPSPSTCEMTIFEGEGGGGAGQAECICQ